MSLLGLAADSLHRGSGCAELAVLDSGATSPTMRRLWKASRGFQLFVSSLLKRTWDKKPYSIYKQRLSSLNTLGAIQAHLINNNTWCIIYAMKRIPLIRYRRHKISSAVIPGTSQPYLPPHPASQFRLHPLTIVLISVSISCFLALYHPLTIPPF